MKLTRRAPGTTNASRERGAVLYEVLIFMAVIVIVSGAWVTSNASMTKSVKDSHTFDIGNEAAHGILEEIQGMPWNTLAVSGTPAAGPAADANGEFTVKTPGASNVMTEVCPVSTSCSGTRVTRVVRGTSVDIVLSVKWKSGTRPACAGTPGSTCEAATGYGTKIIRAVVTWTLSNGTTRSRTQTIERTATPVEALMIAALPSGPGATPTGFPTPTTSSSPTALDTFTG